MVPKRFHEVPVIINHINDINKNKPPNIVYNVNLYKAR